MRRSLETRETLTSRGGGNRAGPEPGSAVPGVGPRGPQPSRAGGDSPAGSGLCGGRHGRGVGAPLSRSGPWGRPGQGSSWSVPGLAKKPELRGTGPQRPVLPRVRVWPQKDRWAEAPGSLLGGSHSVGSRLGRPCGRPFPPRGWSWRSWGCRRRARRAEAASGLPFSSCELGTRQTGPKPRSSAADPGRDPGRRRQRAETACGFGVRGSARGPAGHRPRSLRASRLSPRVCPLALGSGTLSF